MRSAWSGVGLAIAVGLGVPAGARADDYVGPPSKKTTVVELNESGIVPMDLTVGKVRFHQLLIRDAPTDPAVVAGLKPDSSLTPRAAVVATNRSENEVEIRFVTTFLDEAGQAVLACDRDGVEQDEETFVEVVSTCGFHNVRSLPAAQWARVVSVQLTITTQEKE